MNKCMIYALVQILTAEFSLPENSLTAIVRQESSWDFNALSGKGARGLMQLTPIAIKEINQHETILPPQCSGLTEHGVFNNPKENITAGACFFKLMMIRFKGVLQLALAAYNCGEGCAKSFPWPKETIDYAKQVPKYMKNPQNICKKHKK